MPASAQVITSPHDLDARDSKGRATWIGYKAHLTETCDEDLPHLITHVRTCPGTEDDATALPIIHEELAGTDRLPGEHMVDAGYTTGEILVSSEQEYGVEVIGPVRPDTSWQGRQAQVQQSQQPQVQAQQDAEVQTEGEQEQKQRFDISAFRIDRDNQQAICPRSDAAAPSRTGGAATSPPTAAKPRIQASICDKSGSGRHYIRSDGRPRDEAITLPGRSEDASCARTDSSGDEYGAGDSVVGRAPKSHDPKIPICCSGSPVAPIRQQHQMRSDAQKEVVADLVPPGYGPALSSQMLTVI